MKTTITKRFTFEAAHRLNHHDGQCARDHGHSYKLEVSVSGVPIERGPKQGMVMDFADLKDAVQNEIIKNLDHQDLNTQIGEDITGLTDDSGQSIPTLWDLTGSHETTAENLAKWIFLRLNQRLHRMFPFHMVELTMVRLWETESGWVTVEW